LEPSVQQSIVKRDRFDARPIDGWRSPHNLSDTVHPPVINTQLEEARTTSAVRLHWDSSHGSCDRHILPVFQSYSADQGARAKGNKEETAFWEAFPPAIYLHLLDVIILRFS
jgi:hypothetical protein